MRLVVTSDKAKSMARARGIRVNDWTTIEDGVKSIYCSPALAYATSYSVPLWDSVKYEGLTSAEMYAILDHMTARTKRAQPKRKIRE